MHRLLHFLAWISLFASAPAILITNDSSLVSGEVFDYVIVGAGAAGLALANRLTEDPDNTVLVIEAGGDQQNNSAVNDPGQEIPSNFLNPQLDWLWNSTAQQNGRIILILGGKCLGGGTCINNMMLSRGTVDQYDGWEKLGNPTWNFESVQSFMKKSESFVIPTVNQTEAGARWDPEAHGEEGLVFTGFDNPLLNTNWLQLYTDILRRNVPDLVNRPDFASGHPNGAGWFAWTIHPGNGTIGGNRRSSAAVSYVYPFLTQRPNLSILVNHQASRIIWDTTVRSDGLVEAVGVEFLPSTGGSSASVGVSKEVISSASTIGSPRFLELSGIGNRTILEAAGVEVAVDLPAVGTNFQDQPTSSVSFALAPNNFTVVPDPNGNGPAAGAAYLNYKQIFGDDADAFAANFIATIPQRAAEVVSQGGFSSVEGLEAAYRVQATSMIDSLAPIIETLGGVSPANGGFSAVPITLVPTSRGSVHVVSSDPMAAPSLDTKLLSSDPDLLIITRALQQARTFGQNPPLLQIVGEETSPGLSNVPANATDAQWQSWILQNYRTAAHPVGTVPMLPRDMGGAVDPNLRVYGTANVRVADASIIPIHVSAHTSSTCYGIGEKAADIIKNGL